MKLVTLPAAALVAAHLLLPTPGAAQGMGAAPAGEAGKRVYKSANCVGCHNWTGTGGGGYGGSAANLRATELTREQIVETIRCGRPATGMPYFERDGYADGRCFGLTKADLAPGQAPPAADKFLRPADVEAVADYVVAQLQGRGAPSYEECQAFFGTQTRACNNYRNPQAHTGAADAPAH